VRVNVKPGVSSGLNDVLSFQLIEVSHDRSTIRWTIDERHLQPDGIAHGGAYCAAHELAASAGGAAWLGDRGTVVGTNNSTDFLRPGKPGDSITTTAVSIHRGRTQQLWRVESVDQMGRLLAHGQVRLANLDRR
jgi:1,4-dihydroxy-2-naphthoyl-CoA hydrolase